MATSDKANLNTPGIITSHAQTYINSPNIIDGMGELALLSFAHRYFSWPHLELDQGNHGSRTNPLLVPIDAQISNSYLPSQCITQGRIDPSCTTFLNQNLNLTSEIFSKDHLSINNLLISPNAFTRGTKSFKSPNYLPTDLSLGIRPIPTKTYGHYYSSRAQSTSNSPPQRRLGFSIESLLSLPQHSQDETTKNNSPSQVAGE